MMSATTRIRVETLSYLWGSRMGLAETINQRIAEIDQEPGGRRVIRVDLLAELESSIRFLLTIEQDGE
jgi:hypothetical protein